MNTEGRFVFSETVVELDFVRSTGVLIGIANRQSNRSIADVDSDILVFQNVIAVLGQRDIGHWTARVRDLDNNRFAFVIVEDIVVFLW